MVLSQLPSLQPQLWPLQPPSLQQPPLCSPRCTVCRHCCAWPCCMPAHHAYSQIHLSLHISCLHLARVCLPKAACLLCLLEAAFGVSWGKSTAGWPVTVPSNGCLYTVRLRSHLHSLTRLHNSDCIVAKPALPHLAHADSHPALPALVTCPRRCSCQAAGLTMLLVCP